MTRNEKLRALGRDQLAWVHGGGILLPTLGQTKESSSQVAIEEISMNFEKLEPRR